MYVSILPEPLKRNDIVTLITDDGEEVGAQVIGRGKTGYAFNVWRNDCDECFVQVLSYAQIEKSYRMGMPLINLVMQSDCTWRKYSYNPMPLPTLDYMFS